MENNIKEDEVKAEQVMAEAVGNVSYWRVTVGPRSGDLRLNITGFNFSNSSPWCILFQSRQGDNVDNGWPDQFAIQVLDTTNTSIRVRIRRIDNPMHGSGWGQNLTLNFLIRE